MKPIKEIEIANYEIEEIKDLSGEFYTTEYGTSVPIEYWKRKPNFSLVSIPIISHLRTNYEGQKIGLRMLSSKEHPEISIDELLEKIKERGHDRYDARREGNGYENIGNKKIELFLLEIEVGKPVGKNGEEQIQYGLNSFYLYPFKIGGIPKRIDIGIIYDLNKLESVTHYYEGREKERKTDGYIFKDPNNKSEAILEIIRFL